MNKHLSRKGIFTLSICLIITSFILLFSTNPVNAAHAAEDIPTNESCLECHDQPDWNMTFDSGDILNLSISSDEFDRSVHKEMQCIECHIGYEAFPAPHNQVTETNKRDYLVSYHETCQKCHGEQFKMVEGNVHETLYQEGNHNTPICSDCHQPHTQVHMDELDLPRENGHLSWQAETCAACHESELDHYKESVHGQGLLANGNDDMPDCVDCHHVHQICDPTQAKFRQDSVDTCAKCHTNAEVMEKYGMETNVLDTYLVFHDTTVTILEDYDPDSLTNKPTCYDCHGIHEVGSKTPPPIEADISAMTLYPDVEVKQAGPPMDDVGFTGLLIGFIVGIVCTLTISQLVKENRNKKEEEGTSA